MKKIKAEPLGGKKKIKVLGPRLLRLHPTHGRAALVEALGRPKYHFWSFRTEMYFKNRSWESCSEYVCPSCITPRSWKKCYHQ
jgi:hypothetical protein